MAIIGIGTGTCTLGRRNTDKDGKVISETPAKWEPSPDGGSVAIWPIDPETMTVNGVTEIYGDWDAAHYLPRVLEMIQPSRKANISDFRAIIEAAAKDGFDVCEYCTYPCCRDCIVEEWRHDGNDE